MPYLCWPVHVGYKAIMIKYILFSLIKTKIRVQDSYRERKDAIKHKDPYDI